MIEKLRRFLLGRDEERRFCIETSALRASRKHGDVHFLISGWPEIRFPDGESYFDKKGTKR